MSLPFDSSLSRREYDSQLLDDSFGNGDPHEIFREWIHDAATQGVLEPDAMNLATFDGKRVNSRTVALRGITDLGLLIYTNYHSQKAKEIDAFPEVSVTFHWKENFRQVRLRGTATKTSAQQSDEYFASRPRGSQVGAWVSRQSETLSSRAELIDEYNKFDTELSNDVERPPFWGGYEIVINEYEFMQGHKNRLHDRFSFTKNSRGNFESRRLWP